MLEYHGNGGGRGAVGGAGVHDDQLIHASQSTHDSQSIHESELIHDNQLMHDGQPNGQQLLNHWRAVEQLPLDLGPRHYLLEGALLEGSTEHQQQMQRVVEEARRGDVVRWVVPEEPMGEEEEAAVDALRARGVCCWGGMCVGVDNQTLAHILDNPCHTVYTTHTHTHSSMVQLT